MRWNTVSKVNFVADLLAFRQIVAKSSLKKDIVDLPHVGANVRDDDEVVIFASHFVVRGPLQFPISSDICHHTNQVLDSTNVAVDWATGIALTGLRSFV